MDRKKYGWLLLILLALVGGACQQPGANTNANANSNSNNNAENARSAETGAPKIEVAPVAATKDGYKILAAESVKLTIRADAPAQEAQIFYQPVTAGDRALRLKTLIPTETDNRLFESDLKIPVDFSGEMWAQVRYSTGDVKETERLLVSAERAKNEISDDQNSLSETGESSDSGSTKTEGDESARADKFTGGKIKRADLQPNGGKISVTVNVPAFLMTLWQGGKEIETYYVGVGRKNYPIPVGLRTADKIILNPDWIPPDSEWVRKSSNVEPYERIPADDPQNPLGKIKIPLGDAYLLHEAQAPSDIGNLVSHGCVRVLSDDLFEMTRLIAEGRGVSVSKQEIEAARKGSERRVINLGGAIPVDINYDSMVVENGVLTIYPDVYERKTNTVENLRAELESQGLDVSEIDEKTMREMLEKVSPELKFVIALTDLKAGNALSKGKTEPLTPQQAKNGGKKSDA